VALRSSYATAAALLASIAAGIVASLAAGQDAQFDLLNYHLYNAFALLDGRIGFDLAPGSHQTFFNPLLDLPYYWLAVEWLPAHPRIVAAVQGIPYGLLIFLAFRINRRVFPARDGIGTLLAVIATALGVTAAATVSEIGTTMGDIPVAVLVLAGLSLLLRGEDFTGREAAIGDGAAGFLFGAAAGLKLVSAIFAPAAVVAILAVGGFRLRSWCRAGVFAAGAAIGFALAYGWWAWRMWTLTGSPAFPFFNAIFRSPWLPLTDFLDKRFLPRSLAQALFYPFWWVREQHGLVTELDFRDARLALAMVAVIVLAIAGAMTWRRGAARSANRTTLVFLVVFAVVGYVAWEAIFSILRYAVVLEVLGGTLIVAAVVAVAGARTQRRVLQALAAAAVLAGVFLWTAPLNWGRVPFGERTFAVDAPPLPPGSLVVLVGPALSWLLPFLDAPAMRAIGVNQTTVPGTTLYADATRLIAGREGPLVVLTSRSLSGDFVPLARQMGVAWDDVGCRPIASNITDEDSLCVTGAAAAAMPRAEPETGTLLARIVAFGPNPVDHGRPFNVQPGGQSAIWVRLDGPADPDYTLVLADTVLATVVDGNLLTAAVPDGLFAEPGALLLSIEAVRAGRRLRSSPVSFLVQ
jgi:hypothetical protein